MLVLTRKQSEKIRIGDDITITVLRMKGKTVRLGIQAPNNINVLRGELLFELSGDEIAGTENDTAIEGVPSQGGAVRTDSAQAGRRRRQPAAEWSTSPDKPKSDRSTQLSGPLRSMVNAR